MIEAVDFLCTGKRPGFFARGSHAPENDKPENTRLVALGNVFIPSLFIIAGAAKLGLIKTL
jgi:hypothetical protein